LTDWFAAQGLEAEEGLAIDGKTLRGLQGEEIPGVHLVAAYTHRAGAILGQLQTEGVAPQITRKQTYMVDLGKMSSNSTLHQPYAVAYADS
jgi:hypothetical protein